MRNHYSIPYTAEAVVTKRRIVKFGATDGAVLQGAAATDKLIGVADSLGADAIGGRCDTYVEGVVEVEAGAAITRGDLITSDAVGRAVTAAPGAGVNNRIVGIAQASAVLGDVFEIFLTPGSVQG